MTAEKKEEHIKNQFTKYGKIFFGLLIVAFIIGNFSSRQTGSAATEPVVVIPPSYVFYTADKSVDNAGQSVIYYTQSQSKPHAVVIEHNSAVGPFPTLFGTRIRYTMKFDLATGRGQWIGQNDSNGAAQTGSVTLAPNAIGYDIVLTYNDGQRPLRGTLTPSL